MVEKADRDPTMEEIVVALRETRRGAGNPPPLTVVGGHAMGHWSADLTQRAEKRGPARGRGGDAQNPADVADLRDQEIERLLAENARLNERVMFLLKIIEREQAANDPAGRSNAMRPDRDTVGRDVRAALEAELRPVLLVLLRLLEKQRNDQSDDAPRHNGPEALVASRGLVAMTNHKPEAEAPVQPPDAMTLQRSLLQRMVRALDAFRG